MRPGRHWCGRKERVGIGLVRRNGRGTDRFLEQRIQEIIEMLVRLGAVQKSGIVVSVRGMKIFLWKGVSVSVSK